MCSFVKRISVTVAMVILFAPSVSAYTVVLRSGRVVEIPSEGSHSTGHRPLTTDY